MSDGRSTSRVKNKAPAPVQITAEQLLREAQERQEAPLQAPRQRVEDYEELHEFRGRKRKEFEEVIRRTRSNISAWTKYAYWEASQGEFARSRSVYERALDVDATDVKLWLSYTEMELKARNVQHARNLFDRAVTLLPRINQIWYKYVYLEELLGNVAGARQVFERWMAWEPDEKAWSAYIKMELRYHEYARASAIYERLVACHPEPKIWIKWAKYEEETRSNITRSREVFQMSLEYFGAGEGGVEEEEQLEKAQSLYNAFAKLEIRQKEYERARVIYKYALDRLPRSKSGPLYASYTQFEKQFGDREGIESTVLGKRRIEYEDELSHTPLNYDVWIDYCRLEEDAFRSESTSVQDGGADRVRDVYERAVAQRPPSNEKRHWRRYIFLWLNYALFEELDTKDIDRTRQIFEACVNLLPNKSFTFAKVWTLYAEFEIRQLHLEKARKIMGTAIGMCPKEKLFKDYITLELQLREYDRCRQLYQKYLTYDSSNSSAFINFADLERELGDPERARGIFELAVTQELDMPEVLWKAYIDFEYKEEEWDRARALYKRLLERTSHVRFGSRGRNSSFTPARPLLGLTAGKTTRRTKKMLKPRKRLQRSHQKQKLRHRTQKRRVWKQRGKSSLTVTPISSPAGSSRSASSCSKHGKRSRLRKVREMPRAWRRLRRRCLVSSRSAVSWAMTEVRKNTSTCCSQTTSLRTRPSTRSCSEHISGRSKKRPRQRMAQHRLQGLQDHDSLACPQLVRCSLAEIQYMLTCPRSA